MAVIWDIDKERKLFAERNIDLCEVAELIVAGKYLDIIDHPGRTTQQLFIIRYRNYTHVVPFIIDSEENIILKTVFPSRKFHQLYGAHHEDKT
jgi:hypothetical protein